MVKSICVQPYMGSRLPTLAVLALPALRRRAGVARRRRSSAPGMATAAPLLTRPPCVVGVFTMHTLRICNDDQQHLMMHLFSLISLQSIVPNHTESPTATPRAIRARRESLAGAGLPAKRVNTNPVPSSPSATS